MRIHVFGGEEMFFRKKNRKKSYDRETLKPAVRVSICTGERTAGFLNRQNGRFSEAALITSEEDLRDFMDEYGITEEPEYFY